MDRIAFSFDMDYVVEPTGAITVGTVHAGTGSSRVDGTEDDFGPGDVLLFSQPELPCAGRHSELRYSLLALDPSLLTRVAATAPDRRAKEVRLVGHRPVSPAAARRLQRTIAFLRYNVLANPAAQDAPLLVGAASSCCPPACSAPSRTTHSPTPTIEDRRDARPATLRRAIAFIDEHAGENISTADIAAAA